MRTKQVATVLAFVGASLVSLALVHFLTHEIYRVPTAHIVSNLVVTGGAGIGLLYVGYWLSGRNFGPARNRRILGWALVGAVTLLGVFVAIQPLAQETVTREELIHIGQVSVSVGALLGAGIGSFEARALTQAEEMTRVESRVAALEDERERWSELNTVLRHYVNNSVTVINFCLEDLRASVTEEDRKHVETIADRVDTVETVAEHVDRLGPAAGIEGVSPVSNVSAVLEKAFRMAEIGETITVSIPEDGPEIQVGESVEQDLALLLEALESMIEADGRIDCTVQQDGDRIVLRLSATPASLPEAVAEALFEPVTRRSGLKLYLAERSIDAYADLSLAVDRDDTVAFEISFNRS